MDFYCHTFYLIEPRMELADWLPGRVDPSVAEVLLKPATYHSEEISDSTSNWVEADRLLKMKLVFLHALSDAEEGPLRWDVGRSEVSFASLFGSVHLSEALFDQWWTVRRFQTDELERHEALLAHSTEPAAPTGSARVDEWLANLRDWRGKPLILGSVLFHSPAERQISPLIHGSWQLPIVEVLEKAGAVGAFGNLVDDAANGFVAWCHAFPHLAYVTMHSMPGFPWSDSDLERKEWYDKTMAALDSYWQKPPILVDLDERVITNHRKDVLWPPDKQADERRVL